MLGRGVEKPLLPPEGVQLWFGTVSQKLLDRLTEALAIAMQSLGFGGDINLVAWTWAGLCQLSRNTQNDAKPTMSVGGIQLPCQGLVLVPGEWLDPDLWEVRPEGCLFCREKLFLA